MLDVLSRLFRRLSSGEQRQHHAPEFSVHPRGLTFLTEVSAGRWVEEGLSSDFASVGALVPGGYEAYARVLHPAWDASDRMVPWSSVAAWSGRVYHPQMSFEGISSPLSGHGGVVAPWCEDPDHGSMDEATATELAAFLSQFTRTPEECFFGVWEGYGLYSSGSAMLTSDGNGRPLPTPRDIRRAQRIRGCGRHYLLYTGELQDITAFYNHFLSEPPNIWWPADRAWLVATDIDLDSTYVGASQELVNALLRHTVLEAVPAEYLASVAMTADTINLGDPT